MGSYELSEGVKVYMTSDMARYKAWAYFTWDFSMMRFSWRTILSLIILACYYMHTPVY